MQTKSLFRRFKDFVNSLPVGSIYTTDQLYQEVGRFEESTHWKRSNGQRMYRTSTYQTYLKRLGALKKLGRKQWQIASHIPEWFNSKHVNYLLGYESTVSVEELVKGGAPIEVVKMMSIPEEQRHNPFVLADVDDDVDEQSKPEKVLISEDLLKRLYESASESDKKKLAAEVPALSYKNVYNFGNEYIASECWNGPLLIGHGLAPKGLENKCLLISHQWEMKTATEAGLQVIYFVKK